MSHPTAKVTAYHPPELDAEKHATADRVRFLEAKVAWLTDEVGELRSAVRALTGEAAAMRTAAGPDVHETCASFDYQWDSAASGAAMPDNPTWRAQAPQQLCAFTALPPDWFVGKRVLDAGCGQGRWSEALCRLGVGHLVAFDQSPAGLARTRALVQPHADRCTILQRNVLTDLTDLGADFDLVWCFGVLHHTGNLARGLAQVAARVRSGGHLFLMLYGEPRPGFPDDYAYYHRVTTLRRELRHLPFAARLERLRELFPADQVHGWFDAISPEINDLTRWDELVGWLAALGFTEIQRTQPQHPNHHVIARRL